MGKKAQLWSFEKAPMQNRASFHSKKKDTSHCCCESNGSEDERGIDSDDDFRHGELYQRSKRHGHKDRFGFDNIHEATPPHVTGYHPPMPRFEPAPYARPSMYPRPMPLPQYGYYGMDQPVWPTHGQFDSGLPKYNPMIHYSSYEDNYR
ncbi:putative histidine-rich glycoprotein-like [Sesbania bispinosa]|nr:putative histidine-rich glycoprotein-like [Sesbania bispinosa]